MNYIGDKCPYCGMEFTKDDDVVVCPECGTPHHRQCYEQNNNSCVNREKHSPDFVYEAEHKNVHGGQEQNGKASDKNVCAVCKSENGPAASYCKNCGAPLSKHQNAGGQENHQQIPIFLDPLAGLDPKEEFDAGITVGETAKYVKQSTPYFMSVFNNIKKFGRSRFNFAAAIFSGGYLLYRKQYKLGAFITAIQALMIILSGFISTLPVYQNYILMISNSTSANVRQNMYDYIFSLEPYDLILMMLPYFFAMVNIAIAVVLGITENRLYFSHCKKKIRKIKSTCTNDEQVSAQLQTKGGVNVVLVISLMVTYAVLRYVIYIYGGSI